MTPACEGQTDRWFPCTNNPRHPDVLAVVAICHRCPVMVRCAARAEEVGARYGVWAGVLLDSANHQRVAFDRFCVECDARLSRRPEGARGRLPETCSDECRRIRHARVRRQAYQAKVAS